MAPSVRGTTKARRVSTPVSSAWPRVWVFENTVFVCARTVPILMPRSAAVNVIRGVVFVVVVLLFRRGIFGELANALKIPL